MWWMYPIEQYFPFMYALFEAENEVTRGGIREDDLSEIKKKIKNKYEYCLEMRGIQVFEYIKEELEDLVKIDMNEYYKSFLLRDSWRMNKQEKEIANELLSFLSGLVKEYRQK